MTCLRDFWETIPLPQSSNGGPAAKRDFYRPLVELLDRIFHACRTAGLKGFCADLRFHTYDRTCGDQVDGAHPPKPGCFGCLRDVKEGERVFWREIIISIKVNNNWSKLVSQGATYARCAMSTIPGRHVVLVLCYIHDENALRFAFYHPSGLNASKPFSVLATDLNDLRGLVDAFVRLTSVVDPWMVSFDPSRYDDSFVTNSWGAYEVGRVLCERKFIRGRRTAVYAQSQASTPATLKSAPHHVQDISATNGMNIVDSVGPAQLYTAVSHALLGHWNLYRGGLLHCDISIGGVMIMPEEQSRPVMDFEGTKTLTLCQGMLIDFDQAIYWTCWKRKAALRRSSTLPFTSIRLLNQRNAGQCSTSLHNIHTAIDPLESFIWVLIWAVAECIRINELEPSHEESRYIHNLCNENVEALVAYKTTITHHYSKGPRKHASKGFAPFGSLFHELLNIADSASEALNDLLNTLAAPSTSNSQRTVDLSGADQDHRPRVPPDGTCDHSPPQEPTALMHKTYQQYVAAFAKNQQPLKYTKWEELLVCFFMIMTSTTPRRVLDVWGWTSF